MKKLAGSAITIIAILLLGSQWWLRGGGFRLLKNISWLYGPLKRTDLAISSSSCDSNLWKYVYSPERLYVVEQCVAITGKVKEVVANSDGDYHIEIWPDSKYHNTINIFNRIAWGGTLVTEVICAHNNKEEECNGYSNPVYIPKAGERVKITGSYVIDTPYGWNEIHPVSKIETIF